MAKKEFKKLQKTLEHQAKIIKKLKEESTVLKKAIWDMLDYSNMYVVILDSKLNIRLINWSLMTDLGYENEKQAIGKCWLNHISNEEKDLIRVIHHTLAFEPEKEKYGEVTNKIKTLSNEYINVKWFNVQINSKYNMTFSMGVKVDFIAEATTVPEEAIRAYYRDIIEEDRTMIQALKDVADNKTEE